ncbi:MAG: class I SAM-dependent methyltransferase [bacterium]
MYSRLLAPTSLARMLVARALAPGATAVDATAGRGSDTRFLARQVGPTGRVYAFDIQAAALAATRQRLAEAELLGRVELIEAGHERMRDFVTGPAQAVMFNLGYLPGSSHTIVTQPATTLRAIGQSLRLLAAGGLLTVVAYPGHPGGRAETEAVADYLLGLDREHYALLHCLLPKIRANSARIFAVEKGNSADAAELKRRDSRPDDNDG